MRTRARYQTPAPLPSPECLFLGPCRAVHDHKAGQIVIETAKDHPQGFGIEACRLAGHRMAEARAIVALCDLIRTAKPFAAMGRVLAGHDPADPLFQHTAVDMLITAADAQGIAAAYERALGPAGAFSDAAGRSLAAAPGIKPPKH